VAALLKEMFPNDSVAHLAMVSGAYLALFCAVCWLAGMNGNLLRAEFAHARHMLLGGKAN
jgi:hypothetical protein